MPKRDYETWLINELADSRVAASYVNTAIWEDPDLLPVVLREVAKAHTMKKVAQEAGVARESLYQILSESGNPTLSVLTGILTAVGLKLAVVPDLDESRIEKPQAGVAAAGDQPRVVADAFRAIDIVQGSPSLNIAVYSVDFSASREGLGERLGSQPYANQLAIQTSIGTQQPIQ